MPRSLRGAWGRGIMPPMNSPSSPPRASVPAAQPTVYFDGACPVCRREIAYYQQQAGAEGLCWVDAAACAPEALGPNLARPEALARLHLRQADGCLIQGAAAFLHLWAALPRTARWARWALARPRLVALLDLAYEGFLRLRRLWRPRSGR